MLRVKPERNGPEAIEAAAQGHAPAVHSVAAAQPAPVFFHFDLRRSLQMHKKLAGGIFGLFLLMGLAYAAKTWNSYYAESIIYVQPAPPKLMENSPAQHWPYDSTTYESYIQQQIHNVTRPDVLLNATQKIPSWAFSYETPQAAAERLGRKIEVSRVGAGYQISIRARSKDPERAAVMANAVANSFIESATKELRAGDTQRIEVLGEERERIQKELATERAEQEDLNKKLGIAAVSGNIPDPIDEQIAAIRGELIKARTENDEAAARLTAATRDRGNSTALDAQAEEIAASDAGLVSMKTELNKRRSQIITQMSNLTPNHPLYKQDAEELAHINESLDKMSKEVHAKAAGQIEQKLKADLDRTSSVEARLNAQLAQMIAGAGTATPRLQRFNDLTTDIQRLQQRFTAVDEQYRNLTLENNAPGSLYVSAAATPPLGSDLTKTTRICVILLVVGIVLSLGSALTAHNLDKRIYTATDLERVLGFAPMALLPDFHEVGTGVSEEYLLRLAAAVEHAHQQGALKSCIFTGAAAGAGTTTVVNRVSGMLEAMGRETVLVNAAGASAAPVPEAKSEPGMSRDLVPSRGGRSTALLQQMSEVNEETMVLADTAPLLASGETEYMTRFVDAAIVVVDSGVTSRDQLRQIAGTLQRLDVSAVGYVLNRISLKQADAGFRDSVKAVQRHVGVQMRSSAPEGDPGEPRKAAQVATAPVETVAARPVASSAPVQSPAPAAPEAAVVPDAMPEPAKAAPAVVPPPAAPAASRASSSETAAEVAGTPLPRGRKVNHSQAVKRATAPEPGPRAAAETRKAAVPQPAPLAAAQQMPKAEPEPAPPAPVEPQRVAASARDWALPTLPSIAPQAVAASGAPPAQEAARQELLPVDPAVQHRVAPPQAAAPPYVPVAAPAAQAYASPVAEQAGGPGTPMGSARSIPAPEPVGASSAMPDPGMGDQPFSAASRLGGLRNLLVSLGLKTLNSEGEIAVPENTEERHAERSVFPEPYRPAAAASPEDPQPESVRAVPEFLPPRVTAEPIEDKQPEAARPATKPAKPKRPDQYDDLETLPSWRGQYRKRR